MLLLRRNLLFTSAGLLSGYLSCSHAQGQHAAHSSPAASSESGAARQPAPQDAYVYIGWPLNGATLSSTQVRVWFGTRNFGVAPAGVTMRNTGHHHLLIDVPVPDLSAPIPNDRNHLHFGLGQTEAVIDLAPGRHTLQLLMGDADHIPHDPPVMSRQITINVRPSRRDASTPTPRP